MTPLEVLADQLLDARRAGEAFTAVWPAAVEAALAAEPKKQEREQWRIALHTTAPAWRAAFLGSELGPKLDYEDLMAAA